MISIGVVFMNFSDIKFITAPKSGNEIFLFKENFNKNSKLFSARLQVCGLGFFTVSINGKKIDKDYFKPLFTDYTDRGIDKYTDKYYSFYHTYDITKYIKSENELLVYVGGGYFENNDRPDLIKYKDVPAWRYGQKCLKYLITLEYEGKVEYVFSSPKTLCAVTNNSSSIYFGDKINFCDTDYDFEPSAYSEIKTDLFPTPFGGSVSEIVNVKTVNNKPNSLLYDFGINHTGGLLCDVKGRRGSKITVRFGEFLNKDGNLNPVSSSLMIDDDNYNQISIPQENTYILSGNVDRIEPLFSWRCYRYVEILFDEPIEILNIKSLFIHQNCEQTGKFKCSNNTINKIYKTYLQTQLCNLQCGVPTDCPHREKMPYTGDGWLTQRSAMLSFDLETFYSKWLDDIICSQRKDGFVPNTAPFMGCGGGLFWGYSVSAVPLTLYKLSGKKEYLNRAYDSVNKWIEFLNTLHRGDYIITKKVSRWQIPDWLAPDVMQIDTSYFDTICFYKSVVDFIKFNEILFGKADNELNLLAENIKNAINKKFFNFDTLTYSNDIQGETVMALYVGIVPKEYEEKIAENIKKHYDSIKHFDTGIIMTPILLEVLLKYGFSETAYLLLTAKDYPSYSYMLKGETTIPEHWSKHWIPFKQSADLDESVLKGDVSHCHPMYGAIVALFYEKILGIDNLDCENKTFDIFPQFLEKIKKAEGQIKLDTGFAKIKYTSKDNFNLVITVPSKYKARILLPYNSSEIIYEKKIKNRYTTISNDKYIYEGNYRIRVK